MVFNNVQAGVRSITGGNVVARQMYDAWGQVRVRGDLQTDIGYTAQREDAGINVMF